MAASTRPLCIIGGASVPRGASNQWRVGACAWCLVLVLVGVCVLYVACSRCLVQGVWAVSPVDRRSLQHVCLSGLVQLPSCLLALSAAWLGTAGQRCARPDGMLLCRSRGPLPSCRRRAQRDMHGWHSCHTHTELSCRAGHGDELDGLAALAVDAHLGQQRLGLIRPRERRCLLTR